MEIDYNICLLIIIPAVVYLYFSHNYWCGTFCADDKGSDNGDDYYDGYNYRGVYDYYGSVERYDHNSSENGDDYYDDYNYREDYGYYGNGDDDDGHNGSRNGDWHDDSLDGDCDYNGCGDNDSGYDDSISSKKGETNI